METIAIVGDPKIRVTIIVVVEEEDCVGLASRFAHSMPKVIYSIRIVAFKHLSG